MMDDETMRAVLVALGKKLYELQVGMATMFNLGMQNRSFTQTAFDKERTRLEAEPDLTNFRDALERMSSANLNERWNAIIKETKFFN
jgi:hypothetical protein